jgi:hypothetical protein
MSSDGGCRVIADNVDLLTKIILKTSDWNCITPGRGCRAITGIVCPLTEASVHVKEAVKLL